MACLPSLALQPGRSSCLCTAWLQHLVVQVTQGPGRSLPAQAFVCMHVCIYACTCTYASKRVGAFTSWALLLSARKIGEPWAVSARTQPKAHKSTATVYRSRSRIISGARYHRLEMYVLLGIPVQSRFALPKSAILACPLWGQTKMFCGRMSRCTISLEWRKFRPLATWGKSRHTFCLVIRRPCDARTFRMSRSV